MAKFADRQATGPKGAPVPPVKDDGFISSVFPAIWEYLTLTSWEDGKAREVATLLLTTEDGYWKVCLRDRANGRVLWLAAEGPQEVLQQLEDALAGGRVVWRRDRFAGLPVAKK